MQVCPVEGGGGGEGAAGARRWGTCDGSGGCWGAGGQATGGVAEGCGGPAAEERAWERRNRVVGGRGGGVLRGWCGAAG